MCIRAMKTTVGALTAVLVLTAAMPAAAQDRAPGAMPLSEFLSRANRIPHNALALAHPQMRPVRREFEAAFGAVRREQHEAREAGRRTGTCIPDRITLDAAELLAQLNAVPASRQGMTTTQALREWAAREYPCPA